MYHNFEILYTKSCVVCLTYDISYDLISLHTLSQKINKNDRQDYVTKGIIDYDSKISGAEFSSQYM